MKLPSFLFSKKENPQYFLTLLLREEKVSSIVFEESAGKIKILSQEEEYFENSIEEASEDELLEVIDKAVSKAESQIPLNEKQKTVFGLKENWVENLKIKKEYLLRLKKVCEALGLAPIGFLITHEAIANLLDSEEGAPPTAILIEVNKKTITITLIKAGKVLKTSLSKIEDSIPKTTDRILHHFTAFEVLPSRIILFDDKENERLIQEFINHSFSKSLPFLHVPQISTLPAAFAAKAVVFGAASQMKMQLPEEELKKETQPKKVEKKEDIEDIKDKPQIEKDNIEMDNIEPEETTHDLAFGFKEDFDTAKEIPPEKEVEKIEEEESFEEEEKTIKKRIDLKKLVQLLSFFNKVNLPRVSLKQRIIFVPPVIVGLFLIFLILYVFLVRATVTVKLSPKTIDDKQEITFITNSSTDLSKGIIQAESVSISEEGSASTETQGKKEVGDKAKGSITLYSLFSEDKTIPAQTVLTSSNGLKFTLDLAVKIASSSGASSPTVAKASLTAKEIGKEYNLPSQTKFTIGAFDSSDIEAKNETAFSGGTKKEITVVSKEDYDKLLADLPKNLEGKAREGLASKIGPDKAILSSFSNTSVTNKEFSKKIGDEANNVSLKGSVEFTGIIYKKTDLEEFSKSKITNLDMLFLADGLKTEVSNLKNKNSKEVTATLHFTALLVPKVEEKKLKEELAGKSFTDSKKIINDLPQVYETTIVLSPDLPFLPKILPRLAKNISLVIKSNE